MEIRMLTRTVPVIFFIAAMVTAAEAARGDEPGEVVVRQEIAPNIPAPPFSFRIYDIDRYREALALSEAKWTTTLRLEIHYRRGWREHLQESIDRYDLLRTRVLDLLQQEAPLDPADEEGWAKADAQINEAHAAWTELMQALPRADGWFFQRMRETLDREQRPMLHELRSRRMFMLHEADIAARGPLSRQSLIREILDELAARVSAGESEPVRELRGRVAQFIIAWEPEYLEAMLAMTRAADEAWPKVLRHRMRHADAFVPRELVGPYADALLALEASVEAGLTRLGTDVGERFAARVRGRMERTADARSRSDLALMDTFLELIRDLDLALDRAAQVTEIMSAGQTSARSLSARMLALDRLIWRSELSGDGEAAATYRGKRQALQSEREALGAALREEVLALLPPWQAAEVREALREAIAQPVPGRGAAEGVGGAPSLDRDR